MTVENHRPVEKFALPHECARWRGAKLDDFLRACESNRSLVLAIRRVTVGEFFADDDKCDDDMYVCEAFYRYVAVRSQRSILNHRLSFFDAIDVMIDGRFSPHSWSVVCACLGLSGDGVLEFLRPSRGRPREQSSIALDALIILRTTQFVGTGDVSSLRDASRRIHKEAATIVMDDGKMLLPPPERGCPAGEAVRKRFEVLAARGLIDPIVAKQLGWKQKPARAALVA